MNFLKWILTYKENKILHRIYYFNLLIYTLIYTLIVSNLLDQNNIYASTSKKRISIVQLFKKAQILHQQNKYNDSNKILKYILNKYPTHKPSYLLLGKNFYRLGDLKNAAKAFLKSGIAFIDSNSAFEYGVSMFYIGKWSLAIKGLNKVPKVNTLKDLAYFYTAVCYIKMNNLSQAQKNLILAKKLPPTFLDLKRLYLAEINRIQYKSRLGTPPKAYYFNPYNYPLPSYNTVSPEPSPQKITKFEDKKPEISSSIESIKPTTGFIYSITPKIEYYFQNQQQDLHGYSNKNSNKYGPKAEIMLLPQYNFEPNINKRQIMVKCPMSIKIQNLIVESNDIKYFQYTDEDDIFAEETNVQQYEKILSYSVIPTVSIPIKKNLGIDASVKYLENLLNMKFQTRITEVGPQASLSIDLNPVNIMLTSSFLNIINIYGESTQNIGLNTNLNINLTESNILNFTAQYVQTSKPQLASLEGFAQKTSVEGSIKKILDIFEMSLGGKYAKNDPPKDIFVNGILDEIIAKAAANIYFSFGLKLGVTAELSQILKYTKDVTPITSTSLYDNTNDNQKLIITGQRRQIKPYISFNPLEWIYMNASYSFTQTIYVLNTNDTNILQNFKSSTADIINNAIFNIGISKSF